MSFFSDIYYFFLAQEARYQIAIVIVMLLLLSSAVLIFVVLRERSRKNSKEQRRKAIKEKVEPILQEVAFSEQESQEFKDAAQRINKNINSRLHQRSNQQVLNELILYYHRNLGGEAAKRLEELYRQTDLKSVQLDLLKNGEWFYKAKAISDLSSMRMAETLYEILAYTDHESTQVRNEAQFAAVKLGGKKALQFLDDLKTQFSEWQQIRLLDQCLKFDYELLDVATNWLHSSNDSVAIFGLRVTRHLNQYQEIDQIIKLLYHKNPDVQLHAIQTCIDLAATQCLENVHEVYELTKLIKVKQRLIRAFGELGGPKEAGVLREIMIQEKHYDLILEAARSLKRLNRQDLLQSTGKTLPPQGESIVKHVLNERI